MMTQVNWKDIKYFKKEEWVKDPNKVASELVYVLDDIREETIKLRPPKGVPIVIHVAWDDSGHAPKSYHYTGLAVDFHFKKLDKNPLTYIEQFLLLSSYRQIGGLGFYPDWAHPGWHADLRIRNPRLLWTRIMGNYEYGIDAMLKGLKSVV